MVNVTTQRWMGGVILKSEAMMVRSAAGVEIKLTYAQAESLGKVLLAYAKAAA